MKVRQLSIMYMLIEFLGKDAAPASSLHSRTKSSKFEITPAPGDYNPEKAEKIILDNSPKYSFGTKTQSQKISCTPGKQYTYIYLNFNFQLNNNVIGIQIRRR